MNVLLTYGPVAVPLDAVRVITNRSTGVTGDFLAHSFMNQGHEISTLRARCCPKIPFSSIHDVEFEIFDEFRSRLKSLLEENDFDAVIHLAAVSDYSVEHVDCEGSIVKSESLEKAKIDSSASPVIYLKSNEKLLPKIKNWSRNPESVVVGFKYTYDEDTSKIPGILSDGSVDFVVHNWQTGIQYDQHEFKIYGSGKDLVGNGKNKLDMAEELIRLLKWDDA